MLKEAASFVLGSSKSSTYPAWEKSCSDSSGLGGWECYASSFDSPAALLDSSFEHPEGKASGHLLWHRIDTLRRHHDSA